MKRLRVCLIAALGSLASFVVTPLVAQQSFIDVGTLGFGSSYLLAVNNRNEAVGYSEVSGLDSNRAMLWRDGQLIDLGVLPGLMLSVATEHQRSRADRRLEQRGSSTSGAAPCCGRTGSRST